MAKQFPYSFGVWGGLPAWAFASNFSTMQNIDQLLVRPPSRLSGRRNHRIESRGRSKSDLGKFKFNFPMVRTGFRKLGKLCDPSDMRTYLTEAKAQ